MVAPVTSSPSDLATGMDSPVIMDSSTVDLPEVTMPSTGSFSPGRMAMMSPTRTSSTLMSYSLPSRITRAVFERSPASARMASPVPARALASSSWPTSMSVTTTPTASKYGSRALAGRIDGMKVATQEYANAATMPRLTSAFISGERWMMAANPLRKIGSAA